MEINVIFTEGHYFYAKLYSYGKNAQIAIDLTNLGVPDMRLTILG